MSYRLVFDEVIVRQLRELARNRGLRDLIRKMLDKIEVLGPRAGNLLDVRLGIYEIKAKRPPIRLYYRCISGSDEVYVFMYDMKKSEKRQQWIIDKIRRMLKP